MASKVLVPAVSFTKLQVKKTTPEQGGSGFIIGNGDAASRIAHLEHSVRFLQDQHRLMLSGLHTEIEALRERNRDLQFQLIFNKESSPKTTPNSEETVETSEEDKLKQEVSRLEREATAARGEARAAEARALQLQSLVDAQAEKLRELELKTSTVTGSELPDDGAEESRAELRARLAEAERLVRRLRADADRQRREVLAEADGVTNLLFDGAHARQAHLQCMKNSLHASLRASGMDGYYQSNFHFPPVHAPEFWREPLREDFCSRGMPPGGVAAAVGVAGLGVAGLGVAGVGVGVGVPLRARRPLTLPELASQQVHRSTIYANNHTREPRSRASGYEHKQKRNHAINNENVPRTPDDSPGKTKRLSDSRKTTYPEVKAVIAKLITHDMVGAGVAGTANGETRRTRRTLRRPANHAHHEHT